MRGSLRRPTKAYSRCTPQERRRRQRSRGAFLNSPYQETELPRHVAIIPDGNGRWAKLRHQSRIAGHIEGSRNLRDIVLFARELGISILTIYAFSEENWKRPPEEVDALMKLLEQYLIEERDNLMKYSIQLRAIGEVKKLPKAVLSELKKTIDFSKENRKMIVNFAISYGARQELIMATKKIVELHAQKKIEMKEITPELFEKYLSMPDLPFPDLLIRTSGEMRVSNFLLWQIAYSEIYVTEVLWPDFKRDHFLKAIIAYQNRERRYGMISEQVEALCHQI